MPEFSPSGLVIDTLSQIVDDRKAAAQSPDVFGPTFNVDDVEIFGQTLNIVMEAVAKNQELIQEVYSGMSLANAQGVGLDGIGTINGSRRRDQQFSRIPGLLGGIPGTDVGKKTVRFLPSNENWVTPVGAIIPGGGTLAVTLTAQDPGPVDAFASDEWQIETLTPGFNSVISTGPAIRGSLRESDPTFRQRIRDELASPGKATAPAIVANILQEVVGVSKVRIFPNRTNVIDADGVPPHGMELLISGGEDADIIESIHNNIDPSSETTGNVTGSFTDENGDVQVYSFSRPLIVGIQFSITLDTTDAEVPLPDTIQADVQAAVQTYIDVFQSGQDVIPIEISSLVVTVAPTGSVTDVVTLVSKLGDPLQAGVLKLDSRSIASVETQDIAVVVI